MRMKDKLNKPSEEVQRNMIYYHSIEWMEAGHISGLSLIPKDAILEFHYCADKIVMIYGVYHYLLDFSKIIQVKLDWGSRGEIFGNTSGPQINYYNLNIIYIKNNEHNIISLDTTIFHDKAAKIERNFSGFNKNK